MKREFYVCDGMGCGAILVGADDGRVLQGTIKTSTIGSDQKTIMSSQEDEETALCMKCLAMQLGLDKMNA